MQPSTSFVAPKFFFVAPKMAEEAEQKFYYFAAGCPMEAQCSAAAWKRASVWGWSEEEAKQRLKE